MLLTGALALALAGAAGCRDRSRAFTNTDAWYTGLPADVDTSGWPQVETGRVFPVNTASVDPAVQRLASAPAVFVTPEEARAWTGADAPGVPGLRPLLVRAVRLGAPDKEIETVRVKVSPAGDLLTMASVLAQSPRSMSKRPVIVFTDRLPPRVFVTAAAAQ
jgi:hypothetical protein